MGHDPHSSARETERLVALARYDILDAAPEEALDALVQLTAEALEVRVAALNFIGEDRQWCQASVGAPPLSLPRALSPCAVTIAQGRLPEGLLEVQHPAHDPRFAGTALAAAEPPIGLYAGAPLVTQDGHTIGTLCVMDLQARRLSARERRILTQLARLAMDELDLRAARGRLEIEAEARGQLLGSLRQTGLLADTLAALACLGATDLEPPELLARIAGLLAQVLRLDLLALYEAGGSGLEERAAWFPDTDGPRPEPMPEQLDRGAQQALEGRAALFEDRPGGPGQRGRALAWLPLRPQGGQPALLLCQRGEGGSWRRRERNLLETAAQALCRALERQAQLGQAQQRDGLDEPSGLGNLRAFHQALGPWLSRGEPGGLLLLELDGLREVTARQGQARGELLLRLFSQALLAGLRPQERLFRLAEGELAALIADRSEWPTPELLEAWALEQVDIAVSVVRSVGFLEVGASAAIARFPEGGAEARSLLAQAERRLAQARRQRRERQHGPDSPYGGLQLNPDLLELRYRGQAARLRPKEAELLDLLSRDPSRVCSREELSRRLWEGETPPSGNVLEVHLTNLRKKLAAVAPHLKIRAVRGQGYTLVADAP